MRTLKLILLGIFVLYFQLIIAPKFTLYRITPNFFIAYLIFININLDLKFTLPISFSLGIAFDLIHPSLLGLNTFSFLIISFLVSKYHQNINKQRFTMVALSVCTLNIIHYLIFVIYNLLATVILPRFFLLTLFAIIYNTLFSILTIYIFFVIYKLKLSINV